MREPRYEVVDLAHGGEHSRRARDSRWGVRLAKILVKRGLLTTAQLQGALGLGQMDSKRLSSYLIEKRILTSDQVAEALAEQYGVPPALSSDFLRADSALRRRVGAYPAMELQAIPLYVTGIGRVAVAMANPENPRILDKLESLLGATVEPMVAPDLVITKQLEVLYCLPKRHSSEVSLPFVASPQPPRHSLHRQARVEDCEIRPALRSYRRQRKAPRLAPLLPGTRSREPAAPVSMIEDALCFTPTPLTFIPPLDTRTTPPVPTRVALRRALTPVVLPLTRSDTALVVEKIRLAKDRQAVSDGLFTFMRGCFGVGAMFAVAGAAAQGQFGFSNGMVRPELETMSFSLSLPSCFRIARSRRATFRGVPPPDGLVVHRGLWVALHCQPPSDVLVSPVIVDGQVTLLLYAQSEGGGPIDDFAARRMDEVCGALSSSLLRLAG